MNKEIEEVMKEFDSFCINKNLVVTAETVRFFIKQAITKAQESAEQRVKDKILESLPKLEDEKYVETLMKRSTIGAGMTDDERYGLCVSRMYGRNEAIKDVIDKIKSL